MERCCNFVQHVHIDLHPVIVDKIPKFPLLTWFRLFYISRGIWLIILFMSSSPFQTLQSIMLDFA